ncbi:serine hydrolase domain-containing protein, partial [Acinetobacter baumannii]
EKSTTPDAIMRAWAGKPLDFKPGDDWQYSNTGYTVAGRIIEKASGMPLFAFLQQRVLRPVGINDAVDCDPQRPRAPDAIGYEHRALGAL